MSMLLQISEPTLSSKSAPWMPLEKALFPINVTDESSTICVSKPPQQGENGNPLVTLKGQLPDVGVNVGEAVEAFDGGIVGLRDGWRLGIAEGATE